MAIKYMPYYDHTFRDVKKTRHHTVSQQA